MEETPSCVHLLSVDKKWGSSCVLGTLIGNLLVFTFLSNIKLTTKNTYFIIGANKQKKTESYTHKHSLTHTHSRREKYNKKIDIKSVSLTLRHNKFHNNREHNVNKYYYYFYYYYYTDKRKEQERVSKRVRNTIMLVLRNYCECEQKKEQNEKGFRNETTYFTQHIKHSL